MKNEKNITIFEDSQIRRIWDSKNEFWYFSIVDMISVLTSQVDHKRAQSYWTTLKNRLKDEGSEVVTKCDQLKMQASDGKYYLTDAADTETMLRLIQSIPSPKAEPFKLWLAKVGYERLKEVTDPEISIDRARTNYKAHGRSEEWIQRRMMGQEVRNKLTDYWSDNDVKKGDEFAILTNIIHQEWTDLTVKDHKKLKGLKTQNLRDHMSEAELLFTALAEMSTRHIAENIQSKGLEENKVPAKEGGKIAKDARLQLEAKTGKKVITGKNYKRLK